MIETDIALPNPTPALEARFESLSIGQLKDRLRLVEAVSKQLTASGTVMRSQIRVAMESIGIVLPSTVPEASYTQFPSKQNFSFTLGLLSREQEMLSRQLTSSLRVQLIASLKSIIQHIQAPSPMCEVPHRVLDVLGKHWDDFDLLAIPQDHPSEIVQVELQSIRAAMAKWFDLGRFGMEATCQHEYRFPEALVIIEQVQVLLDSQFKDRSGWEELHAKLTKFQSDCHLADGCEYTEKWTPPGLMNHIGEFLLGFKEPLPYCLGKSVSVLEEYIALLQSTDELPQNDCEFALYASGVVESFLTWCWRMDNARAVAVECATQMSRAVSHLRSLAV